MATLTRSLEQPQSQTRDLHERPLKPVKWWATLGLIWLTTYAYMVARLSDLLMRPEARRRIERVTGALLVALGVRLVWERGR